MNKQSIVFMAGVLIANSLFAQGHSSMMKGDNSYWICKAYDDENKQWISKSPYKQVAINKAFDECKKQSQTPGSCKTANEYCDGFMNGASLEALFQCTALDLTAQAWVGDTYNRSDEAIVGARDFCKEQSSLPDTCYVNSLTCKNLNALLH